MSGQQISLDELDVERMIRAAAHLTGRPVSWLKVLWSASVAVNKGDRHEALFAFLVGLA